MHVVGKTSFIYKWDHPHALFLRREKKPLIYAFWHNAQVFLAYAHRGENVHVIVSQSKDGEYIAQVMNRLKLDAVRGSTSKGGMQALRQLVSYLKKGEQAAFTPDGPRGPVYMVQGGVVSAAQLSGAPIIPMHAASRRKLTFRSWDQFVVPLPFSTHLVAHGEPFVLPREMGMEEAKEIVKHAMDQNRDGAFDRLNELPGYLSSFFAAFYFGLYNVLSLAFPFLLPVAFARYGFKRSLRDWKDRLGLGELQSRGESRRLWFHASSLGEWQALKPVLREIRKIEGVSILLTVNTPEAKEILQKQDTALAVTLIPLDVYWMMSRWIKCVTPHAVILVETEIWPNLIALCDKKNIPLMVVNGRLSDRSSKRWRWVAPFIRNLLGKISWMYVRTRDDRERFMALGASSWRVQVAGNTKTDNLAVYAADDKAAVRKRLFGALPDAVFVVAGSTWNGEEELMMQLLQENSVRLILAPRRPERFVDVEELLKKSSYTWSLWSEVKKGKKWDTRILLVNSLGDLTQMYAAGDVAFVGGSVYPKGGQNPLEPSAAGVPTVFGPSMEHFSFEAKRLIEARAAFQGQDGAHVLTHLRELIGNGEFRKKTGEAAMRWVKEHQGVSTQVVQHMKKLLGL